MQIEHKPVSPVSSHHSLGRNTSVRTAKGWVMMLMCIVHFFLYQADIREGNLVAAMHRTETESPKKKIVI